MSRLLEALDARINPVWVKEVRQSLRGKLFRIGYLATLLMAGLASTVAVANQSERMGVGLFEVGFVALSAAILGLVPFAAFYATPSEREVHSLDLVLISGLTPGQIARGRLLGAMTQSALFLCAFLPFLSLSAVLPGVDLGVAAAVLVLGVVYSAGISASVIALGLVVRNRLLRALVGLWLSGTLFYVVAGAGVTAAQLLDRPASVFTGDGAAILGLAFIPPLALLVFGLGASSAALAHPEENRSTPLRLATLFFTLVGLMVVLLCGLYADHDATAVAGLSLIVALGFPLGAFLCEPDRLGRRVVRTLPDPYRSFLMSPLLPGGARAGLLTILLLGGVALFTLGVLWLDLSSSGSGRALSRFATTTVAMLSYGTIYLFTPPLVLRPWLHRPPVRWTAILAIPGLALVGTLLPALLGVFASERDWSQGRHIGNPFWALGHVDSSGLSLIAPVMALAGVIGAIQLARGVGGAVEAYELSARRDREA